MIFKYLQFYLQQNYVFFTYIQSKLYIFYLKNKLNYG